MKKVTVVAENFIFHSRLVEAKMMKMLLLGRGMMKI
jgi:hypothetical protein